MKFLSLSTVLAAMLFSAAAVVPYLPVTRENYVRFALEVTLTSSQPGTVQLYPDTGDGFQEKTSIRLQLGQPGESSVYRFTLKSGNYRALRLDPNERPGNVIIESARIIDRSDRVLRAIKPLEFKAAAQIDSLRESAGKLVVAMAAEATDPQILIQLTPPVSLTAGPVQFASEWLARAGSVFLLLLALLWLFARFPALRMRLKRLGPVALAHPRRAIAVVAALAVIASAWPVVILGRSYVSPNLGTPLLYDAFPTLPGYSSTSTIDVKGSDIGAIMWSHIPLSMIQHDALLLHGEIPLWNRYNSAGTPLLAQGQSMFGDPLHFLVILANGAAWAWDIKYIVAKWLFATGLGLVVLTIARLCPAAEYSPDTPPARLCPGELGAALVIAIAAPFMGFFIFRINHPAIFSVCYAPWALYCWVRLAAAPNLRSTAAWTLGLIAANWTLMNSGTAKEAYMLLISLNFSGLCVLLATAVPWRTRILKLASVSWAGLIFVLISAPIWLSFLDALAQSYTSYNAVSAYQVQPGMMLGAFDEIFYRPLTEGFRVFNPSVNFLILAGLLYFLATLRVHFANRAAIALAFSALVPLAFAFGFVPPQWIVRVPFLGNVAHLDNSFTCVLLVLWSVLAGVGFARAAQRLGKREGRDDLIICALLLFALVFGWIAFRQAMHRAVFGFGSTFTVMKPGDSIPVSPFIWVSLAVLLAAVCALALVSHRSFAKSGLSPARVLVIALCLYALVWRQTLQAETVGFEDYTVRPMARVNFHAPSIAMRTMQATQKLEPTRGIGFHGNFFPGWNAAYCLEGASGPDALILPLYRELIGVSPVERIWDWRLYLSRETLPLARPFLDALNVRYYFDYRSDQGVVGSMLSLVGTGDLDTYESQTAWPRAFFTDRLAIYETVKDFAALIANGDGRPFAAMQAEAAARPSIPAGDLANRRVVPARNYRLTTNTTAFDIDATGPGIVVLTEAWLARDFHVSLDGERVDYLRLNHAFKGVVIPTSGRHRLEFTYRPRRFGVALNLALLGAGLLSATVWLVRRAEKRDSQRAVKADSV